ncbi:CDP-alcohol phosphatidyltransferase family protein [Candidatus Woesearchaeota archaeon]|nr:CDP-alcohol phosphatidyltransferase family protein [Candidatus Woesearchaeota archaeon]
MDFVVVQKVKKKITPFLTPLLKFLDHIGVTAHFLTFISFISGLFSLYFLFTPQLLLPLAFLHIVCDVLDGQLARYSKTFSPLGFYLDYGNDRLIELLLLLRISFHFHLSLFVVGLFFIHQLLYFVFNTNLWYGRTLLLLFSVFQLFTLGIFVVSIIYAFGIFLQLREIYIKH